MLEAIEEANALYGRCGPAMKADETLSRLLHVYRSRIEQTSQSMRGSDMVAACSSCARVTGSCCFQEVETWYDPVLLLCNLLLGVLLPETREVAGQCLFLGRSGCKLRARYAFCINYLCPQLKAHLRPQGVRAFLATAGAEIYAGWQLECGLRRWLSSHARRASPGSKRGSLCRPFSG